MALRRGLLGLQPVEVARKKEASPRSTASRFWTEAASRRPRNLGAPQPLGTAVWARGFWMRHSPHPAPLDQRRGPPRPGRPSSS